MKAQQPTMSPLDVLVLLKIISLGSQSWNQKPLAVSLFMSQLEKPLKLITLLRFKLTTCAGVK